LSTTGESSASERVADVLKSGLERQLVEEQDAIAVAGHGSHIVTNKFEPGAAQDAGRLDVGWDDEKFRAFADRLSELKDDSAV
jgi:hypothetical protein